MTEISKEDREFYAAYIRVNSPGYPYEVPEPGEPQCEAGGVRNGPDGPGGTEHYWSCTAPGTIDVDGTLMCDDHAGERGYGPKQEEYGFDPHDGLNPTPTADPAREIGAQRAAELLTASADENWLGI